MLTPLVIAQAAPGGGTLGFLVPMLLMMVIFYFLLIRPQQQRAREHAALVAGVRKGDTVVTSGGFIGKVTKASDNTDEVEVELNDNLRVRVLKSTLADVRDKTGNAKTA
ncbi:MAG: preprotein translocase subunit YajC [Hyphomicrobiaceae bacterium]